MMPLRASLFWARRRSFQFSSPAKIPGEHSIRNGGFHMNNDPYATVPVGKADETAGSAAPTEVSRIAGDAEALCGEMERLFRRGFGEIPKAGDLGELRALQAMLRNLVHRATQEGSGTSEAATAELESVAAERDKFKDALQREKAAFLNYQARAVKDLERAEEQSLRKVILELLPILDNLDLATADAHSAEADPQRVKEALDMTGQSLKQTLAVRGLERIEAQGKPFDPMQHEAVFKRPVDPAKNEKPNAVVEECRTGYLWKGFILRPAQVVVSEAK
jgi:molecular chaperone GrpE